MKNLAKSTTWPLFTSAMMALLLEACITSRKASQPFAVERQTCVLKHINFFDIDEFDMSINIDIPVNAPKELTDSITAFINENLYEYFEDGREIHKPYKSVYSTDLSHIADHYWDAYRSFYDKRDPNNHWLYLNLVAQTDTYVTYEEIWAFRGEGIHEVRHWTTFAKKDGLRLKEVISNENIMRFYEDFPEWMDFDIVCELQRDLSEGYDLCFCGLLSDSLAFQYVRGTGHEEVEKYDLKVLKPYLSEEARNLVSGNGLPDAEKVFGEIEGILGTVKTAKGETVYVAARYEAVMAYTKTDKGYVPIEVFKIGDGYQRFINDWNCSGWNGSNLDSKYFVFNASDNTLYVPKIKTVTPNGGKGSKSFNDRYYVYRFDGEHFVNKGEDCGFWLHPSIGRFEALEYWGKTREYQVRIDRMADGTRRLAAWKNKGDMKGAPDILVEGGRREPGDGAYHAVWYFEDADNRFVVVDQFELHEFQVYDKEGRLYFSENLEEVYN